MPKRRCPSRPHDHRRAEDQCQPPSFLPLEARLLLDAKWTVMVYIDGDNTLEAAAINDFLEMSKIGSGPDVKVVVEIDRTASSDTYYGYDDRYGDWTNTRRGLITTGAVPSNSWGQSIGEADMANPATLTSFVNWAESNYPAQNYAVVLWDHGGGYIGCCWDETTSDSAHLTTADVSTAMAGFTKPVQLLGFDACLMAMAEVVYQVKDQTQVFVTSQETEDSAGWSYNEILGDLTANPNWTPLQWGSDIVDRYQQDYQYSDPYSTLSAIDMAKFAGPDGAVDALDAFTNEVIYNATDNDATEMANLWWYTSYFGADDRTLSDFTDLGTFLDAVATDTSITQPVRDAAQAAMDAYTACIVNNFSGDYAGSTGLSVYLPRRWADLASDYNAAALRFVAETGWGDFLQWWNNGQTAVPNPKISLTGGGRPVQSGSAVASVQCATDFGVEALGLDVIPGQYTHQFTIINTGTSTLHLTGTPMVQIGGVAAGDFTVTTPPPGQIAAGDSATFTITFDATAVGARNATVRIHSDDLSRGTYTFAIKGTGDAPTLSVDKDSDPIVVTEGNSGTTDAIFTVTISRDPAAPTDVNYATVAGTATDGVDYTGVSGTLTFLPGGPLTQTVTVPVLGESAPELDEAFYLDLSGATKAAISTTQGRGECIIKDDDGVPLPFGGTVKASFYDSQDHDKVTVSLTGPGQGTVLLDSDGNCVGIGVDGAQAASTLTVAVQKAPLTGNGQVTVRDIVINGSMKSIAAGAVNLTGDVRMTGLLGSLVLNNLTGGGTVNIDTASEILTTGAAVTITLGRVTDTAVNTHALPIKSLTAIEWLNTAASAVEQIAAPSLATLTIKGGGKAGPAGDFQAALLLDASDEAKKTLGTVKIAGAVAGTEWDITGAVGAIAITGATSNWTIQGPKSDLSALSSLTMGLVGSNVVVKVDGPIGALKATEWVGGTLAAQSIGSLTTVGIAKTGPAGNFGPAVHVSGPVASGPVLGTVKIAGAIADSSWLVDGSVGAVTVAGATTNWTLEGSGPTGGGLLGVKSLTVGQATNCKLQLQDVLGSLKATSWTTGYIEANRLDALSVVGNKTLGVSGDFTPTELKVLGNSLPLHKAALGSVSIAGDVQNSLWYVNGSAGAVTVGGWVRASDLCMAGAIASLSLGATDSSDFFAGLDFTQVNPDALDLTKVNPATIRCADAAGDFIDPKAKIGSVTIRGLTVAKGQTPPRFTVNSNFSAPYFGAVKLTNLAGGNTYGLYTVANYLHIANVSITDTLNHQTVTWAPASGKQPPVVGSMVVQCVV